MRVLFHLRWCRDSWYKYHYLNSWVIFDHLRGLRQERQSSMLENSVDSTPVECLHIPLLLSHPTIHPRSHVINFSLTSSSRRRFIKEQSPTTMITRTDIRKVSKKSPPCIMQHALCLGTLLINERLTKGSFNAGKVHLSAFGSRGGDPVVSVSGVVITWLDLLHVR